MINEIIETLYNKIPDYYSRTARNQTVKNCVRWVLREQLKFPYSQIADYEQERYDTRPDHSTLINSVKRATDLKGDFLYSVVSRGLQELLEETLARHGRDLLTVRGSNTQHSPTETLSNGGADVPRMSHGKQPTQP